MKYLVALLLAISVMVSMATAADAKVRSSSKSSRVNSVSSMTATSYTSSSYRPSKALHSVAAMRRPAAGGSMSDIYTAYYLVTLNNQAWAANSDAQLRDADNSKTYGIEPPMTGTEKVAASFFLALLAAACLYIAYAIIMCIWEDVQYRRRNRVTFA